MLEMKPAMVITALCVVESLQLLAIVAHVYSFIPIHWNVPIPPGLEPERESFLYILFLSIAVAMAVLLTFLLQKHLIKQDFLKRCYLFLWVETIWTFLMLFAFFKWVTYRYPFYNILPIENGSWVIPFFYMVVAFSLLSKIFWLEIEPWIKRYGTRWFGVNLPQQYHWAVCLLIIAGIVTIMWPNATLTALLINQWSHFVKWQSFGMTQFLIERGFQAEQIIMVIFGCNMVVLSAGFVLVLRYLKSIWLSLAVVVTIIQMTFFHYGMSPVCWNNPEQTLINLSFDLGFFNRPDHPPMFMALRVRQFLSFFMGYGIIIFYIGTLLNAWGKDRIAVALSLLGLLIYTRYLGYPDVFAFGAVCWPAVILCGAWIRDIVEKLMPDRQRMIYIAVAIAAVFLLLTNRVFVVYPHFWMSHV